MVEKISFFSTVLSIFAAGIAAFFAVIRPMTTNKILQQKLNEGSQLVKTGQYEDGKSKFEEVINYQRVLFTNYRRTEARLRYAQAVHKESGNLGINIERAIDLYRNLDIQLKPKAGGKYKRLHGILYANMLDALRCSYIVNSDVSLLGEAVRYGKEAFNFPINDETAASICSNLGVVYSLILEKKLDIFAGQKAICYSNKALQYYESSGDSQQVARVNNNLANIYAKMLLLVDTELRHDYYDKAILHYEKCLEEYTYSKNPFEYAREKMNLGVVNYNMAVMQTESRDCFAEYIFRAQEPLSKAIELFDENGYHYEKALSAYNLAKTLFLEGTELQKCQPIKDTIAYLKIVIGSFSAEKAPQLNACTHFLLGQSLERLSLHATQTDIQVAHFRDAINEYEKVFPVGTSRSQYIKSLTRILCLSSELWRGYPVGPVLKKMYQEKEKEAKEKLGKEISSNLQTVEIVKSVSIHIPDELPDDMIILDDEPVTSLSD